MLIQPLRNDRAARLLEALRGLGEVDEAFVAVLEADQAERPPMQDRDTL